MRIRIESTLLRSQHEQQAAVVVVGREHVGHGVGGQVALGVHLHPLAQRSHAPLERGLDRVVGPVVSGAGSLAALALSLGFVGLFCVCLGLRVFRVTSPFSRFFGYVLFSVAFLILCLSLSLFLGFFLGEVVVVGLKNLFAP